MHLKKQTAINDVPLGTALFVAYLKARKMVLLIDFLQSFCAYGAFLKQKVKKINIE
jgi:hypothetical protein